MNHKRATRFRSAAEIERLDGGRSTSEVLPVKSRIFLLLALLLSANTARAQFSPALLQNDAYWNDGKAEFSIYGGVIGRYGAAHPSEVIHILVREPFDPKQLVKPNDWKTPGTVSVLKMNQILHVPTGLYVYQQMHSNFWQVDNSRLNKFTVTSNDSCGNTYKEARREGDKFTYEWRTYWDGMAGGSEAITPPADGYFYDELPWLVRTVDFKKTEPFEIQLAGTTINSKKDAINFQPAKIAFKANERSIEVTVEHTGGRDLFTLDRDPPHLLREWKAADGSHLKMKRNLKVDYWNYNKPGDRERALNNPMLRLPD